jgi:predicted AAA+ superfamily ATPase
VLDSLQMIFERLINNTSMLHHRFLYHKFNLNNRLTGLIGPRGVGKTTLLLQLIKQHYTGSNHVFYVSADHIYFKEKKIYSFIEELYLKQSITTFFIDEIHKYDNWNQELKNIYDGFPEIKIVFSGSSSLDLIKGSYDLSRRANVYFLPGLSFREYLNFSNNVSHSAYTFADLMQHYTTISKTLANIPGLLGDFHDYLKQGFYPFFAEDPLTYYQRILRVIDKSIYEDISNLYNMKTGNLRHLGKILNYLVSIPPGEISTYNLGKNLSIDDKTAAHYLNMLKDTGLVEIIYPRERGNLGLRKPEKVFLNNTNLHYALGAHSANQIMIGTIRELAFVQSTKNAGLDIFHNKQGDYQIGPYIFEIGGKNKTKKQITGLDNAFIVKDDTVSAMHGIIPLVFFGFLY